MEILFYALTYKSNSNSKFGRTKKTDYLYLLYNYYN